MPVSHHAVAPVRQTHALHPGQERLGLRLDGPGQELAGTAPQDGGQGIIDVVGLAEGDNGAIARHGVSLLREVRAGFVTPRYAAFTPSPSSRHSSEADDGITQGRLSLETAKLSEGFFGQLKKHPVPLEEAAI